MSTLADNSAAGLNAQLDEVWSSLQSLGASMTDEEWHRPTSCPGWAVADQYAHVVGGERMLVGWQISATVRPAHDPAWVLDLARQPRTEVLRCLAEVVDARRAELATMTDDDVSVPSWSSSRPDDYRRLLQVRAFDGWVHDQDVRDAIGRPGLAGGPAAVQAHDEIVRNLGYIVGKKAAASDGDSVRFELTSPLERIEHVVVRDGRAQVVDGFDGRPSVVLRLSSTAFARLACGRVDAGAVLSGAMFGGVGIDGDEDLGRRVVTNMTFTFGPKTKPAPAS